MDGHAITMLGTGLIGDFYTNTLHGQRSRDRVRVAYSRSAERGQAFSQRWGIPEHTDDLAVAINHPETDIVVVGLPNHLHEEAVTLVAAAGKSVLCTKPLGRTAAEAERMLQAVERAGVFAGYLEDLCYTPKTLKAIAAARGGAIGDVTWVRSRETHPGPHSAWFWDGRLTGGGAIIDLGCHCIEIIRNFVGKGNRPVEVLCHTDTLVHPIADEDNAIALIRFEIGRHRPVRGQLDLPWRHGPARRGGRDPGHDLDEPLPAHGLRDVRRRRRRDGYVAEKAETSAGWLFPVGDEVAELGYVDMFSDMFRAIDEGRAPQETFYDGYVVNTIMDACYRSARASRLGARRPSTGAAARRPRITSTPETFDGQVVIKREIMPDGRHKLILKDPASATSATESSPPADPPRLDRARP